MRVLITGMSGSGKSAVVRELRRRGHAAYDADDDGYTEPGDGVAWRWRVDAVAELLASADREVLFFAGCSDEQTMLDWDLTVLLTAPEPVLLGRLRERSSNSFGRTERERAQVRKDLHDIEPLLRRSADDVIDTTQPVEVVADLVLAAVGRDERTAP